MAGILVLIDEENRQALDLDNRPPEFAVALLDKLQAADPKTTVIVILGSITMARELRALLDQAWTNIGNCYHFPISCLPKAALICSALSVQLVGCSQPFGSIDCFSLVIGVSALEPLDHEGLTVQKAFFQTIDALSAGEIASAHLQSVDLEQHIVDANLGNLQGDFRLAARWLRGILDIERRVLFPDFLQKNKSTSSPEVQYRRRNIVEQLCSEGVFRYTPNKQALLTLISNSSCYEARENVFSILVNLVSNFDSEVSKATFGLACVTIFLSHVIYLIGKSRYSVASGDPLNGYAFAFRAMEVSIYLELLLNSKATLFTDRIQVTGIQKKTGVGDLLALAGTDITNRAGKPILDIFTDAATNRNKCMLGHEFLVPTPVMCKELSGAVVKLSSMQAGQNNGALIWSILDDFLFDPRFLESIRTAFLERLFQGRAVQ